MIVQRSLFALLAAWLGAGCYDYRAIASGAATEGTTIRVALSDEGTVTLRPLLGPSAAWLEGQVQEADDSSVTLGVTELLRRNGIAETWTGESVRILRSQMDHAEQRRFSAIRTGAVAAILTGVSAIVATSSHGGGSVFLPQRGPPPPGH